MSLNSIEPEITPSYLRRFGLQTGILFIVVFSAVSWIWRRQFPVIPNVFGIILILWAMIHPTTLVYVYLPWMRMAAILGRINTSIILSLFFFAVILPVSLLLRVVKYDPVGRSFRDTTKESWRVLSKKRSPEHMSQPY